MATPWSNSKRIELPPQNQQLDGLSLCHPRIRAQWLPLSKAVNKPPMLEAVGWRRLDGRAAVKDKDLVRRVREEDSLAHMNLTQPRAWCQTHWRTEIWLTGAHTQTREAQPRTVTWRRVGWVGRLPSMATYRDDITDDTAHIWHGVGWFGVRWDVAAHVHLQRQHHRHFPLCLLIPSEPGRVGCRIFVQPTQMLYGFLGEDCTSRS